MSLKDAKETNEAECEQDNAADEQEPFGIHTGALPRVG
jgi:hypothetical protein